MQASPSPSEAGGGYGTRRGHVPQLSISDPSHHVTEAIGHMYEDDYDRRESKRLSFLSSPLSESISIVPPNLVGSEDPASPQSLHVQNYANSVDNRQANGHSRPPLVPSKSFDRDGSNPASPGSTDTATTSFPLNDIDYESDPAAVAQELSNLAAIRRMSMDVTATGDPDLPSFSVPSIAPSPSADENDAARLFWVPARLHPELAPKEFKSFLESKAEQIRRKSGEFSPSGFERDGAGGSLRRKKSMLSRQIDTSQGYTDGAERLERKRSQSNNKSLSPNLLQLESLVDDSKQQTPSTASVLPGVKKLTLEEDVPILPAAPPGHSLRRSTRTQYRKAGSLRKGEKVPYSKRTGKASDTDDRVPSITPSSADEPSPGLTRVATDPTPSTRRAQAEPQYTAQTAVSSSTLFENSRANGWSETNAGDRTNASAQARHQWHSRISYNGRSTLNIPPTEQRVPEIVETPPVESPPTPTTPTYHHSYSSGREASQDAPPVLPSKDSPLRDPNTTKRPGAARQSGKESSKTLNDFANNPQPLPGNTTRTDNLSFIPTISEDRKPEPKKSKDKKDSEGGRKSSWHWLLGSEEKEKDKDKEKKKDKDKDSDSKKSKSKAVEKVHEPVHVTSSNDISPRGRESITVDQLDPKLEEERRKDHVRRTSGESKKDKESGLFSSIFGGGRKKNSGDGHHKKNSSRTLSPDPPVRELRPDVDYPWTRFSILEERAIYRMAHIKLANPRRALYSQVLLSNFMYSYLAKVQQMHPHMMMASSASQRQQPSKDQNDEYSQYQRYQESQQEQYSDSSYDDPQTYEYGDDRRDTYRPHSRGSKYENGNVYGPGYQQYGHSTFGDDVQLDDDDDDMW